MNTTKSERKILDCPFCGGEAAVNETTTYNKDTIRLNGQDTFYGVNCIHCGANNNGILGYKTEEEAIGNWNKRANAIEEVKASEVSLEALVRLLTALRSEWIKERDKFTFSNKKFAEKKAGIYALDEAIKTIKAGEVKRYKDENFITP